MKGFYQFARGLCVVGALCARVAVAAAACNKIPVQPESSQAIGRDMIVNGVPTSVTGMQFSGTADDVSAAFREFWTSEDVPQKASPGSSGLLLSALDGPCLYVLDIPSQQDTAPARGLMSVIRLGTGQATHRIPNADVPLPDDSKIVSDVESRDPGQTGRTWLLDIPGEARWNARRYRVSLVRLQWVSLSRQPDYQSAGSPFSQGTAFAMQHGSESIDASFSDHDGRTVAVIHATRKR
jgi:hypothetical protein